jgi:hypothetical protein
LQLRSYYINPSRVNRDGFFIINEFSTLAADELSVVNNSDHLPVGISIPVFSGFHTPIPEIVSFFYDYNPGCRDNCLVIDAT